jgi:hypothetical protein
VTITLKPRQLLGLLLIAAAIYWQLNGPSINLPALPNNKVTAATYIYDVRTTGGVPPGVLKGLDRLNREKNILASKYEYTEGERVPTQYAVPVEEAKKVGLPSLVVMAGEKAVKVVQKPATEEQIWGAVQ